MYRLVCLIALLCALSTPVAFAVEPPPLTPQGPIEVQSPTRAEIVLNGIWHFRPEPDREHPLPWGSSWVPGDWSKTHNPGVVSTALPPEWAGIDLSKVVRATYERTIRIPESWQGRRVLLDLQRVSTDAEVYLDGQKAGEITSPYGDVDVTPFVHPGQDQRLTIRVVATPNERDRLVLMGVNQISTTTADLDARGITGDVVLRSLPTGPHVSDVFVKPSVRKNRVEVDVELSGVTQAGPATLQIDMVRNGKVEKSWSTSVTLTASPAQTLTVGQEWPDATHWDLDAPNLYTARVTVSGNGVQDSYPQTFGFREFWIDGKRFFLNGTEIRLRPCLGAQQWSDVNGTRELIAAQIDGLRRFGYNIEEFWPFDHFQRGVWHFRELWATVADEKGWLMMGNAPSVADVIFTWRSPNWEQPGIKEAWMVRAEREIRRYRNHPSIVMWTSSGNVFGHPDDQNPRRIGRSLNDPIWKNESTSWQEHQRRGVEAREIVRRWDPTRPLFYHQGTNGDVYALNNYLDLIPLQEREEWLSEWAKSGDMPYMAVEFGTPLDCSFFRGRNAFAGAMTSEPLVTEYAAIYLGPLAYTLETDAYRNEIAAKFQKDQTYSFWQNNQAVQELPSFQQVESLFVRNTWRSWRTAGITGGMVPWSEAHGFRPRPGPMASLPAFQPGRRGTYVPEVEGHYLKWRDPSSTLFYPSGAALREVDGPTLAYIGGAPDPVDKQHHYVSGQTLTKSLVLMQEGRTPVRYRGVWSVQVGGTVRHEEIFAGDLGPAQTRLVPLRFTLPMVTYKTRAEIRLTVTIGTRQHIDRFPFRLFPRWQPTPSVVLDVWDPRGETRRMLRALGFTVRAWTGTRVPFLIVGRRCMEQVGIVPSNLSRYVQQGGRLLVMAQTPEWLEKQAGFRVSAHAARRVFPVADRHPVMRELDADDLRDWNGSGNLIDPKPRYEKPTDFAPTGAPWYGWRWGLRHTVATGLVEKPHHSGWRPLLEADFDLAYSPLLELDFGRGRVTLCQLDFESQATIDPAATILLDNLLTYARTARLPQPHATYYTGGPVGRAHLLAMGVKLASGAPTPGSLLIVGEEPADLTTAQQHRGTIFLLPSAPEIGPILGPPGSYTGNETLPPGAAFVGISRSDLHPRVPLLLPTIDGQARPFTRMVLPESGMIRALIDPWTLDADKRTYLRLTSWRFTRAIAQVLANCGATFANDGRFLSPQPTGIATGLYHPDYRADFDLGDNPFRYFRW